MSLLRICAITAIVLALKMAAIGIVQGRARVGAGIFVNPEDAKTFSGTVAPEEAPAVKRAARAWRNDLENIPIFLILAWIYVAAGLSVVAFATYCMVFMLARTIHTVCYLNSLQPWRTVSYTIGSAAMLALIVHLFLEVVLT